jgi:hypothetical protein
VSRYPGTHDNAGGVREALGGDADRRADRGLAEADPRRGRRARRRIERELGFGYLIDVHRGLKISEEERQRFAELDMEALDEAGLPDDEPFREAVRSHIEFGTRVAQQNSRAATDPDLHPIREVPRWTWRETLTPSAGAGPVSPGPTSARADPGRGIEFHPADSTVVAIVESGYPRDSGPAPWRSGDWAP